MIFVSHASEDKEEFVRPLAHALKEKGLKVWYDEFTLRPGDSLRRSIDKGLSECSGGVIVLSTAFFAKEWPQRELDALFSIEVAGRAKLIPIWHQIDHSGILKISPLLADRLALQSTDGVEAVAERIAGEFPVPAKISGARIAEIIESYQYPALYEGEALNLSCQQRFLRMNAFKEDFSNIFLTTAKEYFNEEREDFPPHIDEYLEAEKERLRNRHHIPDDVYLTTDEPIRESDIGWWTNMISGWVSGTLGREESFELVRELDLQEFDEYYVLLGIPNFSISNQQRDLLEMLLIEMGSGFLNEFSEITVLCEALRTLDVPEENMSQ